MLLVLAIAGGLLYLLRQSLDPLATITRKQLFGC